MFRVTPISTIFSRPKLVHLFFTVLPALFVSLPSYANKSVDFSRLTLQQAVEIAQNNDPWLTASRHLQASTESLSIASSRLPDPKISIGVANLAADSFNFDQEAMTQLKLNYSQMFPRGDTLELKKTQLQLLSSQHPFQRADRQGKVAVIAAQLWLETFKAQQSIALIERDRALFEQLADVAHASYSAALGKTRQQDIVRAQLELTQLDDRLTQLKQKKEMAQSQLNEWLGYSAGEELDGHLEIPAQFEIDKSLPEISLLQQSLVLSENQIHPQTLYQTFSQHPAVNAITQKFKASEQSINLAKQQYKPEWGVAAGYGIRNSDAMGNDRSDLFSIGISFDLPIFTANKQDKQVQAAISKSSAIKSERWLLIRKMMADFEKNRAQLKRLNQRKDLFQQRLIPQMHDQAEASLTAYTNDDGDFAEVVRSRIAELNASIDTLAINVEIQKSIIQLNYYFMQSADEVILSQPQLSARLGDRK